MFLLNQLLNFLSKNKKILIIIFFVFQYLLFRQFIYREILPVYPIAHDQVIYLNQAFEIYKNFQTLNFPELFRIIKSLSTGVLLQSIAGFLFLFSGPSREIALTINFIFFVLVQLNFIRVSKIFFKSLIGYIYITGLLLFFPSIYHFIGGIFDFRLDFAAFCLNIIILFEIFIYFYRRKYFSITIFIISLTSLFYIRTNLLIVYSIFYAVLLVYCFLKKQFTKLKPLLLAILLSFIFAFPFVILNISNLYKYYYVGHVKGQEVVYRKVESNTTNKIDALTYYPKNLYEYHITQKRSFLLLGLGLLLLILLISKKQLRKNYRLFFIPSIYGLVILGIYTADEAKSSVIGMNLIIPIMAIFFIFFYCLYVSTKRKTIIYFISIIIFIFGIKTYFSQTNSSLGFAKDEKYLNVVKFVRYVNSQIKIKKIEKPIVATFYANELSERLLMFYYMYDYNEFKSYSMVLGNSLGPFLGKVGIEESNIATRKSNVIFYNVGDWQPDWIPFNQNFDEIRAANNSIVEKYFCINGSIYELPWGKVQAYLKPSINIETSGDWLLNKFNITFNDNEDCLNKFSQIKILGPTGRNNLNQIKYIVSYKKNGAYLEAKDSTSTFNKSANYELDVPLKTSNNMPDEITITSNDYFVPKEISSSQDIRKLLLFKPTELIFQ